MRTAAISFLTSTLLFPMFLAGGTPRTAPARADRFAPAGIGEKTRPAPTAIQKRPQTGRLSGAAAPAGALPNLLPYTPGGWVDPLPVSTVPGTNSNNVPLDAGSEIYIDWAVANLGGSTINQPYTITLLVDGQVVAEYSIDQPHEAQVYFFDEDVNIGTLPVGMHTLQLIADSGQQVTESNEQDNTFTKQVQVGTGGLPNLRPFQPNGWSAPLVVSNVMGTNTDSSPLSSQDRLFIDWAVVNDGVAPTTTTYFVSVSIDGAERGSWFVDPPHQVNEFVFVEDFAIDPLPAGVHTLRLVADVRSSVDEISNSDNVFERQITVQGPATQPSDALPLIFPSIQGGSGVDTGVAIANPTDEPATVELFLFDQNNDQIGFTRLQIGANEQVARTLEQFFGAPARSVNGWMAAVSENLGIVGFFLTFNDGGRNIDGADAATRGRRTVVFPEILTGGNNFTEINLIGSGPVTLELRRTNGSLAQTRMVNLPGDIGRMSFRLANLFSAPIPTPSYILARGQNGIIGYETFGGPSFLAGRNAIPVSESANSVPISLFGAQVAEVTGLGSVVTIVNPTDGQARLDFSAFRTGTPQGPVSTRSMVLGPREMIQQSARALLGLPAGDFVGWMRVDSDNAGVVGDVTFGDNQTYLASVQLQNTPNREFVFSHVADGLGFFTGLTFVNPTNDTANVQIEVFNLAGVRTGQTFLNPPLGPFEHRPRVLSEIIPGFPAQIGGYIRVSSDLGIYSFELFSLLGPGNRLESLAAVPPQRGNGILAGQISTAGATAAAVGASYPASLAKGVEMNASADFVPGEMVVKMRPGAAAEALGRICARAGLKIFSRGAEGVHLLRAGNMEVPSLARLQSSAKPDWQPHKLRTLALIESLNGDPDILYAEPNFIYQAYRTPNDQFYGFQWHYPGINLPAAWDLTTGSDQIIVAVIDTGAKFDHPQLGPRLTGGSYDFISDPQNALDGDGPDANADDPGDDPRGVSSSYHGTHVGGTVGAVTNDGAGVAGVNWVSPLMTLRVLGASGGSNFDIAQAVLYAARLANATGQLPTRAANVINMSLGGSSASQTLGDAIASAIARNVTVVAAAGNENTSDLRYPASFPGVISVGAIDLSGGKAPYSNFGSRVDVVGPGGNTGEDRNGDGFIDGVLSTLWNEAGNQPSFEFYQGTSMASPHVAGVASLMLSVNPTLTPGQVRRILQDTAIDLGSPGRDDTFGYGLIDALAAVRAAAGSQSPATPRLVVTTPSLDFGVSLTQLQVAFTNGGGSTLTVNAPTAITDPPASGWLSASLSGNSVIAQVNRQGLPAGNYTGRIRLTSNGGDATIEVRMTVGGSAGSDVGMVFVLALNPSTFETVGGAATDGASNYVFRTGTLPAGDYLIAAGTDLDDDGFICDEGEFCGFYPVTNRPEVVGVESNRVRSGVNFTVERGALQPAAFLGVGTKGFRIPTESPSETTPRF